MDEKDTCCIVWSYDPPIETPVLSVRISSLGCIETKFPITLDTQRSKNLWCQVMRYCQNISIDYSVY